MTSRLDRPVRVLLALVRSAATCADATPVGVVPPVPLGPLWGGWGGRFCQSPGVVAADRHNLRMPSQHRAVTPQEAGLVGLHAFVDESMRLVPDNQGAYLLAAVVCDPAACDPVRQMLRSLRYRRQLRLHWHAGADIRRTKIAESIGALALPATVVIGMPLAKSKQLRRSGSTPHCRGRSRCCGCRMRWPERSRRPGTVSRST